MDVGDGMPVTGVITTGLDLENELTRNLRI
jgi:hypothetical protein